MQAEFRKAGDLTLTVERSGWLKRGGRVEPGLQHQDRPDTRMFCLLGCVSLITVTTRKLATRLTALTVNFTTRNHTHIHRTMWFGKVNVNFISYNGMNPPQIAGEPCKLF